MNSDSDEELSCSSEVWSSSSDSDEAVCDGQEPISSPTKIYDVDETKKQSIQSESEKDVSDIDEANLPSSSSNSDKDDNQRSSSSGSDEDICHTSLGSQHRKKTKICLRKKRYPSFSSDDETPSNSETNKRPHLDTQQKRSEAKCFFYERRKRTYEKRSSPRKYMSESPLFNPSNASVGDSSFSSVENDVNEQLRALEDDSEMSSSSAIRDSDQENEIDWEHHNVYDHFALQHPCESDTDAGTSTGSDASEVSSDEESSEVSQPDSDSDQFVDDHNSESIINDILYEGCNLTQSASHILILQFSRKYKLSQKAQDDLLTLVSMHCPDNVKESFPKTYKELLKRTLPGMAKLKKTRLCRVCSKTIEHNAMECQNGHRVASRNATKDESFFIDIPLEPQLKNLIEENTSDILASCERQRLECDKETITYKDITDGSLYKEFYKNIHEQDPDETCRHISLMLSTDGAPIFKSVNSSIWPLYVIILELPPNKRYSVKNVLLVGLWYGAKKPDINAFLLNTLNAISKLSTDGLLCVTEEDHVTFKVHLHCCICDLPGKALVLLHKLFNGKFGCSICFHPGLKLPIRGNVRIYPYSEKYGRRTSQENRFHALVAEASGVSVFGVKGFSILLNHMTIPDGCPIDYMHCILQGTGKWILTAMINTKNKDKPFYLPPASQKRINATIESVAVPHDMERKPRTLDCLPKWKATEIQHFLLYFGLPVMKEVLNPDYFHHLALLSTALWIFLKNEISRDEIEFAGIIIKSFCRLMKQYYGVRSQTINAHNLTHLEQQVHIMGPLWTHSSFAFEAMIAHLLKAFKGTRGVADQMATNYLVEKQIHPLTQKLQDSDAANDVKTFSKNLSLSKPKLKWSPQSSTVSFAEPTQLKSMSAEEVNAVNRLLTACNLLTIENNEDKFNYAERIEFNGKVFHSRSYKRAGKSCSFIVQLCSLDQYEYFYAEVQTYVRVHSLPVAIVKLYNQVVTSICSSNIAQSSDPSVLTYANAELLGSNHIPVSGPPEPEIFAFKCESIVCKCILVQVNEPFVSAYVTPVTDINCK